MDIKSHFMPTQPQSVKLVRKLPAVAERHGRTVRFEPTIASNSIPNDVAVILKEKIRTLLLHAKEGEIQLVDGPADTVLRCTVTAYEPMIQRPNKRQIGLKDQQVLTLIGNMEASVQVLDSAGDPIDAGNLKQHLEKDYIVAEQEKKASALGGKDSKSNKAGGVIGMLRGGGDAGDIARVAGAGDPVHDALSSSVEKVERLPTESEWKSSLVEGLAIKVANRIVPVDEEFVVMLPGEKDFSQVCDMAKAGRWGDVQEKLETAGAMSGRSEAYRRYVLGLSSEAIAYSDAGTADKALTF